MIREYYIQNLGKAIPNRPTPGRLIIISADDPKEIELDIRAENVLVSRSRTVGGKIIGCPSRNSDDCWYSSLEEGLVYQGYPYPEYGHKFGSTMCPLVRLLKLLDLPNTARASDIREKTEKTITDSGRTESVAVRGCASSGSDKYEFARIEILV